MYNEIITKDTDTIREFRAIDRHTKPSWKASGDGSQELCIRTHQSNPYLSFIVTEHGEKSMRQAYATLSSADGRELYNWLKTVYEPLPII